MTDRHRSYIAIGVVTTLCALILAFLLPGTTNVAPTKTQTPVKLSLTNLAPTTTSTTNGSVPSGTSASPGTSTTSASSSASRSSGSRSGSRSSGSQGGNAQTSLGGISGGNFGTGGGTTTTHPTPPPAATTSTTAAPATPTTTPPPPANCGGGQPDIGPASGQQWTCSFDSEFTGTTLNTSQWTVQQTSSSGYTDGPANNPPCFVDNPNNVSVGGGYLTLTVRQVAPFTCTKPLGSFRANYTAGEVTSYFKWSQEYGLFEVRAKLPTASVSGLLDTLWLYPSEERLYGGGGASGEIDFAEWWSQYPNWDIPVIHYNNQIGDPNSTTHCDITPGQFNVYGVEWTPLNITILVNGSVCLQDDWDPLPPQTKPEPFNQPFTINLTQALAPSGFSSSTPLPASLEVQWVRVWTENGS